MQEDSKAAGCKLGDIENRSLYWWASKAPLVNSSTKGLS